MAWRILPRVTSYTMLQAWADDKGGDRRVRAKSQKRREHFAGYGY
jgi:hypothetical protein